MKIGVLGGGQLAKMLAISGYPLGIEVICIDPHVDCCAKQVTKVFHSDFDNMSEVIEHFDDVDCVTYETENLALTSIEWISQRYKLLPEINALKITQDRLYEKNFLRELNIPTVQYTQVESWDELKKFIKMVDYPIVLKTRKNGYDGKGQVIIRNYAEAKNAWQSMDSHALIIEKFIAYDFEVSVISVRSDCGEVLFYPLTLNSHKEGILQLSKAPYQNDKLEIIAQKYALAILKKLNYVGVITIEFFCVNDELLINEIAPRVHNSGHWTIEGAQTSQFENHLRAISGLPLGSTQTKYFSAMINCIGKEPDNINSLLRIPGLHYHSYGKTPKPNRKLGHITLCSDNEQELATNIHKAFKQMVHKNL